MIDHFADVSLIIFVPFIPSPALPKSQVATRHPIGRSRDGPIGAASPAQTPTSVSLPRFISIAALCAASLTAPARAQIYIGHPQGDTSSIVLSNHASDLAPEQFLAVQKDDLLAVALQATPSAPASPAAAALPAAKAVAPEAPATASAGKTLYVMIVEAAREHRVGADLIAAVAAAESRFNPRALSPRGAQGLMQLMPATARRFGVKDVWSPEDNLRGGAAYLRWLLDFFGGDTALVLAAYNSGEQTVLRAGRRIPPIDETRRYVPMVLAWQAHYAREFPPESTAGIAGRQAESTNVIRTTPSTAAGAKGSGYTANQLARSSLASR